VRGRAPDLAIRTDNSMRRHKEGERSFPEGRRDAAVRQRVSDGARHVGVRYDLAEVEAGNQSPDLDLERRAVQRER